MSFCAASAMPAATKVKADGPAPAPPLIVKVQCAIAAVRNDVQTRRYASPRSRAPPSATPRRAVRPLTSEAQLLNVSTAGSKVNTNGAMVTMLAPFLVSAMATLT